MQENEEPEEEDWDEHVYAMHCWCSCHSSLGQRHPGYMCCERQFWFDLVDREE